MFKGPTGEHLSYISEEEEDSQVREGIKSAFGNQVVFKLNWGEKTVILSDEEIEQRYFLERIGYENKSRASWGKLQAGHHSCGQHVWGWWGGCERERCLNLILSWAPVWLSRLSSQLRLRSGSPCSRLRAPHQTLC